MIAGAEQLFRLARSPDKCETATGPKGKQQEPETTTEETTTAPTTTTEQTTTTTEETTTTTEEEPPPQQPGNEGPPLGQGDQGGEPPPGQAAAAPTRERRQRASAGATERGPRRGDAGRCDLEPLRARGPARVGGSRAYKATDRVLERTVVVKVLAEHLSDDEKFVARFRREALAVAQLIHPNIVQVFDTGADSGRHYIVMEYVEGRPGPAPAVEPPAHPGGGGGDRRPGPRRASVRAPPGDHPPRRQARKPGDRGPAVNGDAGDGEMTVKLTDFGTARAGEQTRLTQVGSVSRNRCCTWRPSRRKWRGGHPGRTCTRSGSLSTSS